jgi:hypothetical protein
MRVVAYDSLSADVASARRDLGCSRRAATAAKAAVDAAVLSGDTTGVVVATRRAADVARVLAEVLSVAVMQSHNDVRGSIAAAEGAAADADAAALAVAAAARAAIRARADVVDALLRAKFEEHLQQHRAEQAATVADIVEEVNAAYTAMRCSGGSRAQWIKAIAALNRHEEVFAATVAEAWRQCIEHVDGDAEHALVQCWYAHRAALALQHAAVDMLLQG